MNTVYQYLISFGVLFGVLILIIFIPYLTFIIKDKIIPETLELEFWDKIGDGFMIDVVIFFILVLLIGGISIIRFAIFGVI